jgi:asparaginyl-tRNA synthetase
MPTTPSIVPAMSAPELEEAAKKIHIDEDGGTDDPGTTGTTENPFKTLFGAFIHFPPESSTSSTIFYSRIAPSKGSSSAEWKKVSKSATKKVTGRYSEHLKKVHKAEEEESSRQLALAQARKIIIQQDESLPPAVRMKISQSPKDIVLGNDTLTGTRVRVVGRIDNIRASKTRTFVYLSDTQAILLCIFSDHVNTIATILFQRQASLEIYGEIKVPPAENKAPGDRELHVDFYKIIGEAPGGSEAFSTVVPDTANQSTLPAFRHLVLRRQEEATVMKARTATLRAFRQYYEDHDMDECTAPSFVQTQAEGGGSLFTVPYYGRQAYLTQTSQLYLETQLPVLGDCYTIQSSFRAENTHTRRHLSEYTHIEGELDFIVFEDLLQHIEDVLCGVIDQLLTDPKTAAFIETLNPDFRPPTRPFKRIRYSEAIDWLDEHGILTDEGERHTFGVDIAEAAERAMTDQIDVPIFLTHFPIALKAFYMKKDTTDLRVTESVDLLVPGVGEIVGGGMRMEKYDELIDVMRENKWDLESYAFYSDQRK